MGHYENGGGEGCFSDSSEWKLRVPFFALENHSHGTQHFEFAGNLKKGTRKAERWRTVTANLRTAWPTKSLLR